MIRAQLPKENDFFHYNEKEDIFELKTEYVLPEGFPEGQEISPKEWVLGDEVVSKETQKKLIAEPEETKNGTVEHEATVNDALGDLDEELVDQSFETYKKVTEHINDQIIRYGFSASSRPLFYSDYDQFDHSEVPPCPHCGAKRHFEFQVNNTILSLFPEIIDFNWGMFAVYTCSQSCNKGGDYTEEWVGLQNSPDEVDRRNAQKMQEMLLEEFRRDMNEEEGMEVVKPGEEGEFIRGMMAKKAQPAGISEETKKKVLEMKENQGGGLFGGGEEEDSDEDDNWS